MTGARRAGHGARWLFAINLVAASLVATAGAQADTAAERRAKALRRGAGLQVSLWEVKGLPRVANDQVSEMPLIEGYFQRGLDLHLAMETTIGVYRREQKVPATGGIGGSPERKVTTYVIPQFTSIKLYPFTVPTQRFEPYLVGGAGFAFGVDDRENTGSGGLLGPGSESGTAFVLGFGLKGGVGAELRFSQAFGLAAGGRYQWVRYFQELAGSRTYRGFGVDVGLTYRFQYQ